MCLDHSMNPAMTVETPRTMRIQNHANASPAAMLQESESGYLMASAAPHLFGGTSTTTKAMAMSAPPASITKGHCFCMAHNLARLSRYHRLISRTGSTMGGGAIDEEVSPMNCSPDGETAESGIAFRRVMVGN